MIAMIHKDSLILSCTSYLVHLKYLKNPVQDYTAVVWTWCIRWLDDHDLDNALLILSILPLLKILFKTMLPLSEHDT